MGRKFRLSQKKNEECKKYHCVTSLPVSISLKDVSVLPVSIARSALESDDSRMDVTSEMTVSLPIEYFSAIPVANLDTLHARLTAL